MKYKLQKKYIYRTLLIVILPVYTLLAMEAFLRLFAPVPMLPRYVGKTPWGIRGNEPDKQYWHRTPEYKIQIRTNSRGIRADEEFPYEKPPGVQRIVVFGDSFGMGYGVSLENTFTSQLSRYLGEQGYRTELINLSVSGHGNAEQLILLQNEGLRYQPDLVLLQWHSTDIQDNVRSGLFTARQGQLERKNQTYLPGVEIREFLFQCRIYRFLAENSHFYNFFREKAAMAIKDILVAVRNADSRDEPDAEALEQARRNRERLTLTLLHQMQQVSIENGAEFLIFEIPRVSKRTRFWSVFPETEGTPFDFHYYNPIAAFEAHAGQKLYWERSHGHLTPLGCRIAGRGLAQYIIENQLLENKAAGSH